jgi:ABC-type transporter Mla maintaining outer membrane lipid asymmetry ATPase subunit MlaF
MSELIELENVSAAQAGYEVLRDVNLSFPEGRSTVIMGPSGCGKSTLLKVAAGLIPPDRGSVRYKGEDIYWMSERRLREMRKTNGFAFQDAALWENKTIGENLALPLQVNFPELTRSEVERRVVHTLERGGLTDSINQRPAELSGGERKLIGFLRAMIAEPSLFFMDTPTGTIDPVMAERIMAMIREIKSKGCSIVAVTHDRRIASTLADRLVVLSAGIVLAEGEFNTVKNSPDPRVREVLSEVLGEIASFDTDLLTLLGGDDRET